MKTLRTIAHRACSVAALAAGALLLVLAVLMGAPRLFGLQPYAVLSDSMGNTAPYGSLVYVRKAAFSAVRPGDIALFQSQKNPADRFTHRVVSVDAKSKTFVTKGDANPTSDPVPAPASQLKGRVAFVLPWAGLPAALLQNRIAAIGAVLLVVIWAAAELDLWFTRKKTGKPAI